MRKGSALLGATGTGAVALIIGASLPQGAVAAAPTPPPPPSQPVTVTNSTASPVPVAVLGTSNVSAAQSGPWSVAAAQSGTWNVNVANQPVVHPQHPGSFYFDRLEISGASTKDAVGSEADVVYVDSITATNTYDTPTTIFLVAGTTGDGCQTVSGGGSPGLYIEVPARKTEQLTFPTPLEFRRLSTGQPTCIGASMTRGSGISMTVSGYTS